MRKYSRKSEIGRIGTTTGNKNTSRNWERGSRGLARGENSRILRLESKLSDLRMENADLHLAERDRPNQLYHSQQRDPSTRERSLCWQG